uniref:Jasmonate O-methyltransferase n=1 Tax=Oryza brachyantha TaxID=4533 RepID=J3N7B2_ORYBR
MKMDRDFYVIKGDGGTGYAKNSSMQRRAIGLTVPMVVKAIKELMAMDSPPQTMVIADLGCSSSENTRLLVSAAISGICENTTNTMEVQFFLNDLPGNDFNQIFRSLEQFERVTAQNCARRGLQPPPHYIAGLPGSFYNRLFPSNSVHLFHSSFSLMWLSQVPKHIDGNMNRGNIHIGENTAS